MEIPEPKSVPSSKLRAYFSTLRNAILGSRPVAGEGIKVSEFPGQGTIIAVDKATFGSALGITPGPTGFSTITLDVCVDGSPVSHTFVITA